MYYVGWAIWSVNWADMTEPKTIFAMQRFSMARSA